MNYIDPIKYLSRSNLIRVRDVPFAIQFAQLLSASKWFQGKVSMSLKEVLLLMIVGNQDCLNSNCVTRILVLVKMDT